MKKTIELSELDLQHWKPTCVFPEHYLISDDGRIYSVKKKVLLKVSCNNSGYKLAVLRSNNKIKAFLVHRLVAIAFLPNPKNKPHIDHINGDKLDNRVENLRWVTRSENARNPITVKKREKYVAQRVREMVAACQAKETHNKRIEVHKDGVLVGTFRSQVDVAKFVGTAPQYISVCLRDFGGKYKGYSLKRIEVVNESD